MKRCNEELPGKSGWYVCFYGGQRMFAAKLWWSKENGRWQGDSEKKDAEGEDWEMLFGDGRDEGDSWEKVVEGVEE